jgi:predicted nucleotidyltransferase component of viral defense system
VKEHLKKILKSTKNNAEERCILREYLQARTLEFLQNKGAFSMWSFVGGTSLRFLYDLPRFSEDLDFSATKEVTELDFVTILKAVKSNFEKELYDVSVKAKPNKVLQSAFIKFPGLLYELELSLHVSETVSIKLQVDTNAPKGWECENSLVRRHTMLNLNHYTKPSLLAGKVHALLCRRYTKGRDYYDLMWYLAGTPDLEPNFVQLNNALVQTDWKGPPLTTSNWREALEESIQKANFSKVIEDVDPFLEKKEESEMITKENLLKLLKLT